MDFPEEIAQDIIALLPPDAIDSVGLVVKANTMHDRIWNLKLAKLGYGPVSMAQGMWFLVTTNREPIMQLIDILNTGVVSYFDSFVRRWPEVIEAFFEDNGNGYAMGVQHFSPTLVERLRSFLDKNHSLITEATSTEAFYHNIGFRRLVIDAAVDYLTEEEIEEHIKDTTDEDSTAVLTLTEITARRGMEYKPSTVDAIDLLRRSNLDELAYNIILGKVTPQLIKYVEEQRTDYIIGIKSVVEEYHVILAVQEAALDDHLMSYLAILQYTDGDEAVRAFLDNNLEGIVTHHQLGAALFFRKITVEYLTSLFDLARQQSPGEVVRLVKMMDYDGQDAVTLTNTSDPNPFNHTFTILTDEERALHEGLLLSRRSERSKYRLGF